jgi:hypothetical protein
MRVFQSSTLHPQSSILYPLSSIFHPHPARWARQQASHFDRNPKTGDDQKITQHVFKTPELDSVSHIHTVTIDDVHFDPAITNGAELSLGLRAFAKGEGVGIPVVTAPPVHQENDDQQKRRYGD